jgi:hypothetical protein
MTLRKQVPDVLPDWGELRMARGSAGKGGASLGTMWQ